MASTIAAPATHRATVTATAMATGTTTATAVDASHTLASGPPEAFLCPITGLLMEHPVTTANGNTFEYAAIARWLSSHDTDPATNEVLQSKALSSALLVRTLIRDWAAAHPDAAQAWRNSDAIPPPESDRDRDRGSSASASKAPGDGASAGAGAGSGGAAAVGAPGGDLPLTNEGALGKILAYKGRSATPTKAQRRAATPPAVVSAATGHTYEFGRDAQGKPRVRIAGGEAGPTAWVSVPDPRATSVFATPQGLVFFDPEELHDVRVVAASSENDGGPPSATPCKFKGGCTNRACKHDHPFACRFGVQCKGLRSGSCKFLHPDASSVVPLGDAYPLNQECKYSTACTHKSCHFAHPRGRMGRTAPRALKALFATHNPDLSPMASGPVAVDMGAPPPGATHFSFQGEFIFFYTPYRGAWAKEHFRTVTVRRFDGGKSQEYRDIGDYALDGHYCNAAVGSDQYFLLSWWPYEEEAMRAHWEAGRQLRAQGKSLQSAEREAAQLRQALRSTEAALAGKDSTIAGLRTAVQRKDALIARQRREKAQAQEMARLQRQREHEARQEQKARRQRQQAVERESRRALRRQREESWRRQRRAAAASRSERFRLRDPIHVYALSGGASGMKAADWHLVLDYHKGAHGLELSAPLPTTDAAGGRGVQRLKVTEGSAVFEFDLVAPEDLRSLGPLPVVPGRLCEGF